MPKLTKAQNAKRINDSVQSILIRNSIPVNDAIDLVNDLGFNVFNVDKTKNFYRFRQFNPGLKKNPNYYTYEIDNDVKAIIEH